MALDVFFKEDLARILRAINNANELKQSDNKEYDEGFKAALGSVALAFGVLLNNNFSDYERK